MKEEEEEEQKKKKKNTEEEEALFCDAFSNRKSRETFRHRALLLLLLR